MKKNVLALVYVGLLLTSLFVLASCQAAKVEVVSAAPLQTGAAYAMDAVDLKLMNFAEASAASTTAAVHPADRKSYTDSYQAQAFDYEQSADNMAARWLAMGKYYEAHDMLTRDDFDYEQSADNLAARWLAMGRYYEAHDMLTRDDFDYEQSADNLAARWLAIGKGYERLGLLNG